MTRHPERGAVAAFALAVLAVLSILVGAWLRLVDARLAEVGLDGRDVQARFAAEAGINRLLSWFADPSTVPSEIEILDQGDCAASTDHRTALLKRCTGTDGLPAYVGADGEKQFRGTVDEPGLRLEWSGAASELFGPLPTSIDTPGSPLRVSVELRVFAPRSPDAVATVISRAIVDRASSTVRAELIDGPWRGVSYAVRTGRLGSRLIPVRVHWGAVTVDSALDATTLADRLPRLDLSAPVTNQPYPTEPGRDRWAAVVASGPILGLSRADDGFAPPFEHVHENARVPPIGMWSHQALKHFAMEHGTYFATRGTGLLYPDNGEAGITPSAALAAHSGTGRLFFVDTIDGAPPREDNLDTLDVSLDYMDSTAYLGAHLRLAPGAGRPVTLGSPPQPGDPTGPPAASPVTIDGIHYHGLLVVAGGLTVTGRARIVGAVAALQGVSDLGSIEVWHDPALRAGYRTGFSAVVIKPGSQRIVPLYLP